MRHNKLSVVLVLCMIVTGTAGCAKEKVKPVAAEMVPPVQQEKKSISEEKSVAEEKPIATETVSLQTKDPEEPTILELQRAAIRYAEVNPDKIVNWRRQAAIKALMPQVSVGYDTNVDSTITAPSSSSGKTTYLIGPDDTSRGWDFTAKWDLGDLVYNTAQTSIDSRSKLMVELRNDLLELLNTAYFERKKLQRQLGKITDKENSPYTEREIRIEELTATIDGLTGGYLSRRLGKE